MARGNITVRPGAPTRTTAARVAATSAMSDHAALLRGLPALAGADLALVSLVGSRAYGLHHADSDHDFRGVYQAPMRTLLGLGRPAEQLVATEPDVCCYELGKFADLALAANPNVLEILWAAPVIDSPAGAALRDIRDAFLSERVRKTYLGYTISQMNKALEGGRAALYKRRRAKAIRHLFRLHAQGLQLLTTGELTVAVADPERIRAQENLDDEGLTRACLRIRAQMEDAVSVLPVFPDRDRVDELVYRLRIAAMDEGPAAPTER